MTTSSPTETLAHASSSIGEVLKKPSVTGAVLQDFRPICESLPWLISELYWVNAGVEVFTCGEVPYVITNDGHQAENAVTLYMESLRVAELENRREDTSYVLELGAGSGVFAKLFLDRLSARSAEQGVDFSERTRYIVTDGSLNMLNDTRQTGVLADHEDRVVRLCLKSPMVREALLERLPNGESALGSIRTVHANYVLDGMPFTILTLLGDDLWELRLRSRVRSEARRTPDGWPPIDDWSALEKWADAHTPSQLVELSELLALESRYFRVERKDLPYGASIAGAASRPPGPQQFLHSFGALQCLEEVLEVLRPDGYIVVSDYGYPNPKETPEIFEFQSFGQSMACGVNFAQIVRHFENRGGAVVSVPKNDPVSLQARLIAKRPHHRVVDVFEHLYSGDTWERREKPYREAAELVESGRFEAARWKYEEAYRLQPYNWSVLETIAAFLTYSIKDYEAGMEVAKQGLQLNHLSSTLWNILGDCYYGLDDLESAEEAFRQATTLNPSDVRGRLNLAYVFLRRNDYGGALTIIGAALALDKAGEMREFLLSKQSEALEGLSASHARALLHQANRLIGHYDLPGRTR